MKSEEMAAMEGHQKPEPALRRSIVVNLEGLKKILPMVAADSSEWGPTKILSTSTPLVELAATSIVLYLPMLFFGLLPPLFEFLNVVLAHYHIHALHHDPRSVLLSSFALLYEALLGLPPSVVLLRHFISLRLTALGQHFRCVSFQAMGAMAGECND
ncbi:hypothetical protein D1007_58277 [Hordeum vulgare]|nr:hypothetical protein D1007_58277 [Hordeum vulgare]